MTTPAEHRPRRRMARADRERQLLEVAEQVLVELGYAATTMDEIARRAGVTKPLLYDHFGSKDGLVVACVSRARAELLQATEEAMATATTPRESFYQVIKAFFDYIAHHERAWTVLLAEGMLNGPAGDEVEALRQQQADVLAGLFGQRNTKRSSRFGSYAQAVVGACERVALWRQGHGGPRPADAARHVTDLFWNGLAELSGARATGKDTSWAS